MTICTGNKPGGTALTGEGTMDIRTGEITGSTSASMNASTLLSLHFPTTLLGSYGDAMRLKVVPTPKPIGMGEVEALFSINGKTYKYEIPADTQWVKGKRYLYKLNFNGRKVRLDEVITGDWLPGSDGY